MATMARAAVRVGHTQSHEKSCCDAMRGISFDDEERYRRWVLLHLKVDAGGGATSGYTASVGEL